MLLSLLILVPIVGAVAIALLPREGAATVRWVALGAALVDLLIAAVVVLGFQPRQGGLQFAEQSSWVPSLGIQYLLGVDGVSLWLIGLNAFLTPIAIGASWPWMEERAKEYGAFLLLLEAGVMGALAAADVVLFFVFWEVMLIPMYLLIGILGGERRVNAAYKFFIYTAVGSLLMLAGIIALYAYASSSGQPTFALADLVRTPLPAGAQTLIFLAFALAFAIKVPIFPLHTWLPDAYSQAPLTTLVLGTMLVKVGAYGFIRFALPLFPAAMAANSGWITLLAVVGIVYAALCAIAQRDLVRLLAYSSISHMGFIVLGIFALNVQGIEGGLIQMVNHGLSAGVPGLNGFVGEFLTMLGAFQPHRRFVLVAVCGVVLGAIYLFWMFQRVMHGRPQAEITLQPFDLTRREAFVLVPLALAIVWIGVKPNTLLGRMESSVTASLSQAKIVEAAPPPLAVGQALAAGAGR